MQNKRVRWLMASGLVGLTLILSASIALAGPLGKEPTPAPSSGEGTPEPPAGRPNVGGDNPDENGFNGSPEIAGPYSGPYSSSDGSLPSSPTGVREGAARPDEDGFTGERGAPVPFVGEPSASSSELETAPGPDWDHFFSDPQADQDSYYSGQSGLLDPAFSTSFSYLHVAGSTLRPRDSALGWDNAGSGGCVYQTAGSSVEVFNIHMDIPEGSRVDYLRIYYYDTSASDSTTWLTSYDDAGSFADITSASSSGTGGYGTTLSAYLGQTLDYAGNSYVLNWRSNDASSAMRLCGLRLAYRLP